jgi:hypothetical protein
MSTVTISLISHTNAGKTTLARTLLGRDVGEVRDAPHVTTEAAAYTLIEAGDERLVLWDTPGFGDSARLARRLAQERNPIGWFLSEVWDRFRDRAFFLTQHAVRNVRDDADVVLYLVNAAEDPGDAGYLASELTVLAWIGKPVLVLLNQTGPPRGPEADAQDESRWRSALAAHAVVRAVIAFDAFARCWVQEFTLFDDVARVLPADRASAFAPLAAAWRARREAQFDESMAVLAGVVAAAACARVIVPRTAMLRRIGTALGIAEDPARGEAAEGAKALARAVSADMQSAMDRLLAIHGLSGRAGAEVVAKIDEDIAHEGPLDEGKAAAMGGVVSGALTGLAADLAAGGLTFGAGMLTGAVLGALGGAGVARAFNVARGQTDETIRWDDAFLVRLAALALLRYLAVAHYGRGRGSFADSEAPAFWRPLVAAELAARSEGLAAILARRGPDCDAAAATAALTPLLHDAMRAVLAALYPNAGTGPARGA